MIKREDLHRNLLKALEKKVPDKKELIEMLMEMLFMEKGAVYRRLRGEVPFTFFEVARMAEKLNIPVNHFIYSDDEQIYRFEITEYTNMNDKLFNDYMSLIKRAKNDPHSEFAETANVLPVSILTGFETLTKFYMFKHQYLFRGTESRIPFSKYNYSEQTKRVFKSYFHETKYFANTIHVWDYLIIRYLVTDVKFFHTINLISVNEMLQIKTDLYALLDYIEQTTLSGCFKETGKPVSFHISDTNFDADYCCVHIDDVYVSHVKSFILNSVQSFDKTAYQKITNWISSLKKASTLITKSGAVFRTEFFEKQRMIVAEL